MATDGGPREMGLIRVIMIEWPLGMGSPGLVRPRGPFRPSAWAVLACRLPRAFPRPSGGIVGDSGIGCKASFKESRNWRSGRVKMERAGGVR